MIPRDLAQKAYDTFKVPDMPGMKFGGVLDSIAKDNAHKMLKFTIEQMLQWYPSTDTIHFYETQQAKFYFDAIKELEKL